MNEQTASKPWIVCVNPANKQEIGRVQPASSQEIAETVKTARLRQQEWAQVSLSERLRYIEQFRRLLYSWRDKVASTITAETGKPLMEAHIAEVFSVLETCNWLQKNAATVLAPKKVRINTLLMPGKRSYNVFEPVGVVGVIAPWNYPFSIPVATTLFALAAGNAVILKPSPKTALTAAFLMDLLEAAGFPQGLIGLVQGDREEGRELILSGGIDRISFTGSVAGGKAIMNLAAQKLIPVSLELGGKHAAIVLADSDVDAIGDALVWAAFTNAGQACASIERLYVEAAIADRLAERLTRLTAALRLGDGMLPYTDVGPLVDESQLARVKAQVDDAVAKGAKVRTGGRIRDDLGGYFFEPTFITEATSDMAVMRDEIFGPVLPMQVVKDAAEAIRLANDSQLGLGASIWTSDLQRGEAMAREIQAGMVWINDSLYSHAIPDAPWGGIKHSGFGRMHSTAELLELVYCKNIGVNKQRRQDWHYPYSVRGLRQLVGGMALLHAGKVTEKISGLWNVVRTKLLG